MPNAFRLMQEAEIRVSPITIWEISRKIAIGKLRAPSSGWTSIPDLLRHYGFLAQSLEWEDAEAANRLPLHHRDPMDRMLIATALRADMTIISNDAVFASYGVRTIW